MVNAEFSYEFSVGESHLDAFGHMNNATYFQIFEEARWDIVTKRGYGLERIRETRMGPVILEAKIKFLHELVLGDRIKITTTCLPFEGKIARIHQKMRGANGVVAADVEFIYAIFDLSSRKIVPPTAEWLSAVGLA